MFNVPADSRNPITDSVLSDVFSFYLKHHTTEFDRERCAQFVEEFINIVNSTRSLLIYSQAYNNFL
jgi:hypothetical protein